MLVQRRRRWANIKTTLAKHLMSRAGNDVKCSPALDQCCILRCLISRRAGATLTL